MKSAKVRKFCLGTAIAALGFAQPTLAADGVAKGDTSNKSVVLSTYYVGNSWRQVMMQSWDQAVRTAKARHLIMAAGAFVSPQNSAASQAQQLETFILQGYSAIVLDAASPTALNGVIKEACDAGIVVVSFDTTANAPCAWRIATDNRSWGRQETDYLAHRLNGRGTLLEVRGIAGTSFDAEVREGIQEVIKAYPGLHVVASVYGNWTQTVAQKEVASVLPTLPTIDGVLTQGGDGYGTAQAFKAAGRKEPIIIMGNRHDELQWWKDQRQLDGYQTMSLATPPALSQIALWVAQQILAGKHVPKDITVPLLNVHQSDLDYWLAHTPPGQVTNTSYSLDWTVQLIDSITDGRPPPATPHD